MSFSNRDFAVSDLTCDSILQNRYRILRPLGKGGMGAVYEALDLRLDAIVAVKETFSTDEGLRRQFEREARILAHLHHPALPKVSDYFTEGDRAFLVMQFVEGVDLATIIARQPGPFPLRKVLIWADQLLDALNYLHSRDRQVIHRDIKPHNLKLTPQGQITLLDFGLAKARINRGGEETSSAAIFGYTKQYAPLEQMQDLATGPQSDIYALGATLYHLLTGVKPPDALTRAAAAMQAQPDPLRPAHELHRDIGSEIASILSRAMAQSPLDRYRSAADFRAALRRAGRATAARPVVYPGVAPLLNSFVPQVAASSGLEATVSSPPYNTYAKTFGIRALTAAVVLLFAGTIVLFMRAQPPGTQPLTSATPNNPVHSSSARETRKVSGAAAPVKSLLDRSKVSSSVPVGLAADDPVSGRTQSAADLKQLHDLKQPRLTQHRQRWYVRDPKEPQIRMPPVDVSRNLNTDLSRTARADESVRSSREEARNSDRIPLESPRPFPAQTPGPQTLRTRDGTQVVHYPDGTTRVYRPGERSNQSRQ